MSIPFEIYVIQTIHKKCVRLEKKLSIEVVKIPFEGKEIVGLLQKPLGPGKPPILMNVSGVDFWEEGYTIYNDISARDIQRKEMELKLGPAKGKSFQNSNIMGPCLVTPDEIDASNLRMVARINGEAWSDGNTRDMYFTFPRLVAHLSKDDPVYPGEFIGSGTMGFGSGMELNKWIKPGDVVELEVEGIGILRNRVGRRADHLP